MFDGLLIAGCSFTALSSFIASMAGTINLGGLLLRGRKTIAGVVAVEGSDSGNFGVAGREGGGVTPEIPSDTADITAGTTGADGGGLPRTIRSPLAASGGGMDRFKLNLGVAFRLLVLSLTADCFAGRLRCRPVPSPLTKEPSFDGTVTVGGSITVPGASDGIKAMLVGEGSVTTVGISVSFDISPLMEGVSFTADSFVYMTLDIEPAGPLDSASAVFSVWASTAGLGSVPLGLSGRGSSSHAGVSPGIGIASNGGALRISGIGSAGSIARVLRRIAMSAAGMESSSVAWRRSASCTFGATGFGGGVFAASLSASPSSISPPSSFTSFTREGVGGGVSATVVSNNNVSNLIRLFGRLAGVAR